MDYLTKYFIKQKIKAPWYWFAHRFVKKHKYNTIYTGLKPGYYDCDTRILYGVFQPFAEYMEFQLSEESHVKWYFTDEEIEKELEEIGTVEKESFRNAYEHRNKVWLELLELYEWWKSYSEKEDACWEATVADPIKAEEDLYNEANEKMKRIIELRSYLWD